MLLPYIRSLRADYIIFFLSILIVSLSFTGVIFHISSFISVIFISILLLSILLHVRDIEIKQFFINGLSIIFLIYPLFNFTIEDIVLPSVEALTLITAVRFLGKKDAREYLQIYLLSLLLLGASTLFDISWYFIIRLGALFILTVFSILLLTYSKETSQSLIERETLVNFFKYSLIITLISVPLSILFFLLLPRTPHPLLDIGFAKSKTGFSSTVNLGSVSAIEEDRSVVMRVYMNRIDESELYWRMITFDTFNGKQWTKNNHDEEIFNVIGQKIRYNIAFEPSFENYIPVLDFPSRVFLSNIVVEHPAIFRVNFNIDRQIKYSAESYLKFTLYEKEVPNIYLQITENLSDRFKKLTYEITKGANDNFSIIQNVLNFLKGYEYSLRELPKGDYPVEDFIFNTKKGNCEYFATSMALMLRLQGIPARVVGGFRGGSYNPLGNYYIIRASDAHLWVEAWIDGKWFRFDPSGTRSIRLSEPFILNFLDYIWNSVVVNYDFKTQLRVVQFLKKPDIKINKYYLIFLFLLFLLFISFKSIRFFKNKNRPLQKFLNILKSIGIVREKNMGLEELVMKIEDPGLREKSLKFVHIYYGAYFKDRKFNRDDLYLMNKILGEIDEIVKSRGS